MNIITAITGAWAEVMQGFTDLFQPAEVLFWSEGGLTFLGSLCVIGTSVSVILLVVGIIQRFLKLGA